MYKQKGYTLFWGLLPRPFRGPPGAPCVPLELVTVTEPCSSGPSFLGSLHGLLLLVAAATQELGQTPGARRGPSLIAHGQQQPCSPATAQFCSLGIRL